MKGHSFGAVDLDAGNDAIYHSTMSVRAPSPPGDPVVERATEVLIREARRRQRRRRLGVVGVVLIVAASGAIAAKVAGGGGTAPPVGPPTAGVPVHPSGPLVPTGPTVSVSPDSGLVNGQSVTVTATGYSKSAFKVFLSECATATSAAASQIGCGAQPPAQPFIVLENGRGSTTFTVASTAATQSLAATPRANCTSTCVLVGFGGGALVTVPLNFSG